MPIWSITVLSVIWADLTEILFSFADFIASSSVITGTSAADSGMAAAIASIMILCSIFKSNLLESFFDERCKSI